MFPEPPSPPPTRQPTPRQVPPPSRLHGQPPAEQSTRPLDWLPLRSSADALLSAPSPPPVILGSAAFITRRQAIATTIGLALLNARPLAAAAREDDPPSLTALERTVRAALRRQALARDPAERAAAIHDLCELHYGIVRDPRFRSTIPLQDLRRQVASRLLSVQTDLQRQLFRARQTAGKTATSSGGRLASQTGGEGNAARAGGDGVPDNGQALVDLIQRTIHPDFWDVNGGPGTILYYRPLRCLVVRATDEVHGNVGGAVRALRGGAPPGVAGP